MTSCDIVRVLCDGDAEGTAGGWRQGEVFYFGGAFALDTAELFIRKLGIGEPFDAIMEIPAGCELAVWEKDGVQYLFVLNYERESAEISLKEELWELLSGENCRGVQCLEPYGVRVYRR